MTKKDEFDKISLKMKAGALEIRTFLNGKEQKRAKTAALLIDSKNVWCFDSEELTQLKELLFGEDSPEESGIGKYIG